MLIGTIIHSPHISPKQFYLLGDVDRAKYLLIILLFPVLVFFHGLLIAHIMSDLILNNPRKIHLYQARRADGLNHLSMGEEIILKRRLYTERTSPLKAGLLSQKS